MTISIGSSFSTISYGTFNTNSQALPPDCNGDVGPNHYVEFINGIFAVYDKNTTNRLEIKTDADFWANAGVGVNVSDTSGISDPRIIFDPASQRWFASQIDFSYQIDYDTLTVSLGTNHFLLAVSATSDPTGAWNGAALSTDPNNQYFGDFPTLGVDSQGVYLAADMFDANGDPSTATDVGCTLVSFPKSDLLASTPVFTNETYFENMSFSQRGQIFQPATCTDGSAVGKVLAVGDIGNDSSPHSNIVTFAVQNVTSPAAATLGNSTFITVAPYMVPNNDALGIPILTAGQPDGSTNIQANDARFSAKAYTVGGVIYGVHNTELNNHIAIRWYRIRASDYQLLESGTIADPSLDLFFPSIAANASGTVMICYNGSGSGTNDFVSCYAVAGQVSGGVTTFGNPVLLQSGVTSYHGDDEDPSGLIGNPVSRWGDYSATSVDPSDPNRFWTIQMFPSDTNVWTTQITELITTQPLLLTIAPAGTNVLVSWPGSASNFQLQSTTNLLAANSWSPVTQTPLTNSTQISVLIPRSASAQFFRLQSP